MYTHPQDEPDSPIATAHAKTRHTANEEPDEETLQRGISAEKPSEATIIGRTIREYLPPPWIGSQCLSLDGNLIVATLRRRSKNPKCRVAITGNNRS